MIRGKVRTINGQDKNSNRIDWGAGERNAQRFILAFAVALAVHEIAAALVPFHHATLRVEPVERITIAKLIKIEHRATPTPKPTPTPEPTPHQVVYTKHIDVTRTPTPVINPGAPSQNHHIRKIASARPLVHTRYHSKPANIHVVMGGHGSGTSTKANANVGGVGTGGNGTGINGNGNGTGGAPEAHEPCGFVEFIPTDQPHVDSGTGRVFESVIVRVHFPGNGVQDQPLDYQFQYPSLSQDPFAQRDLPDPAFQFPPVDMRANEPDVIQYVMAHSDAAGHTKLKDCPK